MKDRHEELLQTLQSVYAQTLLPNELIIVDDYSLLPITIERLQTPPVGMVIKILRNDPNAGGAASLNRGSKETTNPFIAFLDSDDCLLPEYIETVYNAWIQASNDTVCIATGFFWCTNDLIPYRVQCVTQGITHELLLSEGNIVGGSSVMSVRREAFLSVGGHPLCRGSHDWGMIIKITRVGKLQTIPVPLMLYRSPTTNPKPNYTKSYRKQIIAIGCIYKILTPGERVIMRPRLRKLVLGYVAKMGRRRSAIKMLCSVLYHDKKFSGELLHPVFLIVFGTRLYDKLLLNYALLRARLFGKKLLTGRRLA